MARQKTFQEKLEEHQRLKRIAQEVIDQMTTKELHQFFARRQKFLQQHEPQMAANGEAQ